MSSDAALASTDEPLKGLPALLKGNKTMALPLQVIVPKEKRTFARGTARVGFLFSPYDQMRPSGETCLVNGASMFDDVLIVCDLPGLQDICTSWNG